MEDFFALERILIARLRERVPALKGVLSREDAAAVKKSAQPMPAAHLVYAGFRVAAETGHGAFTQLAQRWLVIVAIRNVRQSTNAVPARSDAGPIVAGVLTALAGWRPSSDFTPLVLLTSPAPVVQEGIAHIPTLWETRVHVQGVLP